ncbi:PH domain-containing protein [Agreia pratensis]|uniref:PH domain-containing protein n=1 Tax=Agreia pratensis TaxID=150121 RepID=A0A1X7IEP9_9MICO|nr:PH domain-containing protein [Agreia pratensis]SMG12655.1 PH domain-containing protein [Agreia pratensis]
MPAPKHPRPSFGALIHGSDAPTEVFAAERSSAAPAPSAYDETVVTERIRPHGQSAQGQYAHGAPDATGPAPEPAEPERVVAKFRSHGRRLFFPTIFLIVIAGATGYFSGWFAEDWQNWSVLAAGALLAVLFFVVPAVKWLSVRYVLTTRRIILRRGLLVNTRSEVMLARAGDLTVRKSVLQAMFRTGDVRIGTAPGEYAVLRDVHRADLVSEVIGDLIEAQHVPAHAVRFRRPDVDNPWWDEQQPRRPE